MQDISLLNSAKETEFYLTRRDIPPRPKLKPQFIDLFKQTAVAHPPESTNETPMKEDI